MNSPKLDCVACTEAKLSEAPYGPASGHQTKPGELTHMDLWGKYNVESIHGNQYYLLMVDDAVHYITVEFLKTKDQAAQKIMNYMTHLKTRGKTPCAIHADRGTEFVNETLKNWCQSQGTELVTVRSPCLSVVQVLEFSVRGISQIGSRPNISIRKSS